MQENSGNPYQVSESLKVKSDHRSKFSKLSNWKEEQTNQRHYYNQGAREPKPLANGGEVHIQTQPGNRKPATDVGQQWVSAEQAPLIEIKDTSVHK